MALETSRLVGDSIKDNRSRVREKVGGSQDIYVMSLIAFHVRLGDPDISDDISL